MNKKAFTLVELIVVVTILSILAAVWFVSYTSYLSWVRDSNRLSALTAISDGLELYRTKSQLPHPDESIEIKANGERIGWQWEARKNTLNTLEYSKEWVDPSDGTYFIYYLSRDRKNYQLMTLLENDPKAETEPIVKNMYKVHADSIDYEERYPHVSGRNLGIFIGQWDDLNIPINRIPARIASGSLDIVTTTSTYKSYLNNDTQITGNGTVLSAVSINSSCQRLYELGNNENGVYKINPSGTDSYDAYCNMKIAGWGWTLAATRADDAADTWTYSNTFSSPWVVRSDRANLYNKDTIGLVQFRKRDFKSKAYGQMIFKDMMFLDKDGVWWAYNDISPDYNQTLDLWVPQTLGCAVWEGRDYTLTSGNVSKWVWVVWEQQERKLFMSIRDYETQNCANSWDDAYGPTWWYKHNWAFTPDDPWFFWWGITNRSGGQTVECWEARLWTKIPNWSDFCAASSGRDNDGEFIMWFVR